MEQRQLGAAGPVVSAMGLGCMAMSGMYGPSDEAESIRTIQAAVEAGVTLLDTGDFYGMGHNEMLVAKAIEGRRDKVVLSVKFGATRAPGGAWTGVDGRPKSVKNFAAYSLTRLKTEVIDIYRLARLDPEVPIEDTVGAMKDLIKAGYVRHIGLSEVGVETIRRAHAVHPICDLQIEYSLVSRSVEQKILPVLRELGIGVTAYGVLSRGLLSSSKPGGAGDLRAYLPRFKGENFQTNQAIVRELEQFAESKEATAVQIAFAWVMSRGADIIPLIGSRKVAQFEESMDAVGLKLSAADMARLEEICAAVAGTRYDAGQMRMLDSEK